MEILVIDDEIEICRFISRYLTSKGYSIESALSGEEGWVKLSQSQKNFDLIITDIKMPDLDGLSLLKRLRDHDNLTPVIFMTGHIEFQEAADDSGLDFCGMILKPFELKQLIDEIEKSRNR